MNSDIPSIDYRLAKHASQVRFEDLSAHTIARASTFIADTVAVGIAGSSTPESQSLIQTMPMGCDTASVDIWGRDERLDAPDAILQNAFQIHCQEYDCLHEGAVLHGMATLLPVLLAQAQTDGPVNGRDFIAAIVAGTDICCSLGLAAKQGLRFFRPATAGGFGAVAGLARLRNLTAEQTLAAFGFQLAQSSGTMQGHTEGSPVLPLQIGFNARAAWQACNLAKTNLQSLNQPITGKFGFLPMFEAEYALPDDLADLANTHHIDGFSHKPYPSGRATHGAVEGLSRILQEHAVCAKNIQSILVRGPMLINHLVNRPPLPKPTANYARLCMPFVLAKVLQHGEIRPEHYRGDALSDPQTYELSKKVRMETDSNPNPNAFMPQTICVTMNNSQSISIDLDEALASPGRPLTREQCERKFVQCCSLSKSPVADPQALFETLMSVASLSDVGHTLSSLLHHS